MTPFQKNITESIDNLPIIKRDLELVYGKDLPVNIDKMLEDNVDSKSGSNLTYNHTVDSGKLDFDIIGNCEQDTYTGKNKCSNAYFYNENGIWFDYEPSTFQKTFTLSFIPHVTVSGLQMYIQGTGGNIGITGATESITSGTRYTKTITLSDANYELVIGRTGTAHISLYKSDANMDTTTTIDEAQIEFNNEFTSYEIYVGGTASPNPDYPQDIRVVTGDNSVVVQNKNLFGNIEQGGINESGNYSSSVRVRTIDYISVKSNTQYTISGTQNADNTTILCYVQEYDNTNTLVNYDSNPHDMPYTITTQANTKKIRIVLRTTGNANISPSNVLTKQLELGSTATTYIAHAEQTLPIHLGTQYLAGIGDYKDYITGTKNNWKIVRNVKKIVASEHDWNYSTNYHQANTIAIDDVLAYQTSNAFCNIATNSNSNNYNVFYISSAKQFVFKNPTHNGELISSQYDFNTYIKANAIFYVKSETPTEETITDTTLISDLNYLYDAVTYKGQTNITTVSDSDNAQMVIDASLFVTEKEV